MKKRIKEKGKALFVIMLLIITIGYAYLTSNLKINGTAEIANNTWDIHFENIQTNNESVPIENGYNGATINQNNNSEISFSIKLSKPGDFYEFNVDVKNFGTIDGMVESITSSLKINDEEYVTIGNNSNNLPKYINYSINYSDNSEIFPNHELKAGEKETYKIRIEFKTDINSSELPNANNRLTFLLNARFKQANNNAISPHPETVFSITPGIRAIEFITQINKGETIPENIVLYNNAEDALNYWIDIGYEEEEITKVCSKVVLDENNLVTRLFVEFEITDGYVPYGIKKGIYELEGSIDESSLPDNQKTIYNKNKEVLNYVFGENNCEEEYSTYHYYSCFIDEKPMTVSVGDNGQIRAGIEGDHPHCDVSPSYEEIPAAALCNP